MMIGFLIYLNKLFAKIFPFFINIKGVKVYFNSLDRMLATFLWKFGLLEGYEMNLFQSLLKEGDVMLDIGANMGVYSLISSPKIGKSGKVIAFEPDIDNYTIFKKSITANQFKNVMVYPYAVSNKNEKIYFEKNTFNSGNHQIRKEKTANFQTSIDAVMLDDFLRNEQKIDIIKIDIQGAEFFAFEGMKELIARFPKLIIFSEYWVKGLRDMGVNPHEYIDLLKSLNFNIYRINSKKSCIEKLDYEHIKTNPEFEQDYLNFILSKDALNL